MSSLVVQERNVWYREAKRKETFIWSINNFTNEWSIKMGKPDEKFQSPTLKTGRNSEYNWYLEFTPNSQFKLISTNLITLKRKVDIKTKISLLTNQNEKNLTTYGKGHVSGKNIAVYTHSLTAAMVFNKKKELLLNDTLKILIEIESNDGDSTLYEQKDLIAPGVTSSPSEDEVNFENRMTRVFRSPPSVKFEDKITRVSPSVKFEDRITRVFHSPTPPPSPSELEVATKNLPSVIKMENNAPVARHPILNICQNDYPAARLPVLTKVGHGTPIGHNIIVGKNTITYQQEQLKPQEKRFIVLPGQNNKYVTSGEFIDIILDIQGKKLEAHRAILSNQSTVFSNMFDDNKSAARIKNNTVYITNMKPEVGRSMLEFIYTNKKPLRIGEHLEDLMIASDKYKIDKLKALCEDEFVNNISPDTAIDALIFADSCGAEKIKDIAVEFMRDNIEVLDSDKFKKIEEDNSRLAMSIYRKLLMKKPKIE